MSRLTLLLALLLSCAAPAPTVETPCFMYGTNAETPRLPGCVYPLCNALHCGGDPRITTVLVQVTQ